MKYQVIRPFRDKNTGEIYEVGTILELTKKRANEILKADKYIEELAEIEEIKEPIINDEVQANIWVVE